MKLNKDLVWLYDWVKSKVSKLVQMPANARLLLYKEFSDFMTLYAVDVRHCSCACIQDAVSDVFTGIVSGGS